MKKKSFVLAVITAAVIMLVVFLILLIYFYNSAKDYKQTLEVQREESQVETNQQQETAINEQNEFVKSNIINILFLGIDRDEERDKTLGIYRTDSISLANINLDTKDVQLLSIPRDTYTYVPIEKKKDKINHAYAFGSIKGKGVESTIDAVNEFIKYSKVDYYFAIDMQPIPEIVDTYGGVQLDVDADMEGVVSKGLQTLNGQQALAYVRWRYSGNGDIDRIKRQQIFLRAMYNKVMEKDQLLSSISLLLSYNKSVKTNMSIKQLAALSMLFKDIPQDSVNIRVVPGEDRIMDRIWYYFPHEEKTDKMLKEMFLFK